MKIETAIHLASEELVKATSKFGKFASAHEGYAILKKEVDELWDENREASPARMRKEAIQVAAMALRFLVDMSSDTSEDVFNPMRVYLAASYHRREEMDTIAQQLTGAGIEITSRWVTGWGADLPRMEAAIGDLQDVGRSDGILFFAEDPKIGYQSGGRHVEFGYALAYGLYTWIIGSPENVFHHLPKVRVFPSVRAWLMSIK